MFRIGHRFDTDHCYRYREVENPWMTHGLGDSTIERDRERERDSTVEIETEVDFMLRIPRLAKLR